MFRKHRKDAEGEEPAPPPPSNSLLMIRVNHNKKAKIYWLSENSVGPMGKEGPSSEPLDFLFPILRKTRKDKEVELINRPPHNILLIYIGSLVRVKL